MHRRERRDFSGWSGPALGAGIDLPCQTIDEHFGTRFSTKPLREAGLLDVTNYFDRQCRNYAVNGDVFRRALALFDVPTAEASKDPLVNLFTGERFYATPPAYHDAETGVTSPKWVRQAMVCIANCRFNGDALDEHLATLRAAYERPNLSDRERERHKRRYRNDLTCARFRRECTPLGGPMFEYRPSFRVQYTGRVGEIGGGVQSCSREMKLALFRDVAGVHNYDLRASQACILLQELQVAGRDPAWLGAYLNDPNSAEMYCRSIGISRDAFKQCLYATIMGAPFNDGFLLKNALYDVLLDECGDRENARRALVKVHSVLAPLKASVDDWHDWLLSPECSHLDKRVAKKRWLTNACGMRFCIDGEERGERRRKAAAFILQGQEAAYIHHLTLLAKTYGFVPVSNQHDGLVTIGLVPETAQAHAAKLSGFHYSQLIEKPDFGAAVLEAA